MMKYELHIVFTAEQLQQLYAQRLQVVVAKGIYQNGGHTIVVWQAFTPSMQNVVQWDTNYSIYASNTVTVNGAVIQQLATTPAQLGQGYVLNSDGSFASSPASTPGAYTAVNHYSGAASMSFGLWQNNAPVNMVTVALNFSASFVPTEDVTLYVAGVFDSMNNNPIPIVSGQLLYIPAQTQALAATTSTVISAGSPLTMPTGQPLTVAYNSTTSQFDVQS